MEQLGLIHIIMGDGAGKTTAAFGSTLRFCAYRKKALVIQFLKCVPSGECIGMQSITGADVLLTSKCQKFYFDMTPEEQKNEGQAAENALSLAKKKMLSGEYQLIVLDEIGGVLENEMITEGAVLSFLEEKPKEIEIILTGRKFSDEIQRKADYISEIRSVKHPYKCGISARRGIEY